MLKSILKQVKPAVSLLLVFTVLTGIIYPGVITLIAQLVFPWQANGSLVENNGKIVGSLLIGQSFTEPKYFWSRPSATTPFPYNAASSSGSNLSQSNPEFIKAVIARKDSMHKANSDIDIPVPVELVTTSASGLDPEIGLRTAFYQVARIAKIRKISQDQIVALIKSVQKTESFKIFGEDRVNVLELNIALDKLGQVQGNIR